MFRYRQRFYLRIVVYTSVIYHNLKSTPFTLSFSVFSFRLLRAHCVRFGFNSLQLITFVSSSSTLIAYSSPTLIAHSFIRSIVLGFCLHFSVTTVCVAAATTTFFVVLLPPSCSSSFCYRHCPSPPL